MGRIDRVRRAAAIVLDILACGPPAPHFTIPDEDVGDELQIEEVARHLGVAGADLLARDAFAVIPTSTREVLGEFRLSVREQYALAAELLLTTDWQIGESLPPAWWGIETRGEISG